MNARPKPVSVAIFLMGLGAALCWMAFASAASHAAPNPTCGSSSPITVPGIAPCPTTTTAPSTTTTSPPTPSTVTTEPSTIAANDRATPPDTTPPTTTPPTTSAPSPLPHFAIPPPPVLAQHPPLPQHVSITTPALAFGRTSRFAYPVVLAFPLILLIGAGYFARVLTREVTPPRS